MSIPKAPKGAGTGSGRETRHMSFKVVSNGTYKGSKWVFAKAEPNYYAYLLFSSEGKKLAELGVQDMGDNIAEITRFHVEPGLRSLGYGRKIFEFAKEATKGYTFVTEPDPFKSDGTMTREDIDKVYRSLGFTTLSNSPEGKKWLVSKPGQSTRSTFTEGDGKEHVRSYMRRGRQVKAHTRDG